MEAQRVKRDILITGKTTLLDYEKERAVQQQYGRNKLTLTTNKTSEESRKMEIKKSEYVTRQESDRRNSSKKTGDIKVKKIGHESCLAKVIYERRRVKVVLLNGNTIIGDLLEFDKYSLRVKIDGGDCMWIFKSAMIGFKESE